MSKRWQLYCLYMYKFRLIDFSIFRIFIRIVDPVLRPQSEFKVTTPGDKPPLPSFSAPPNAAEQEKMNGRFQQQQNPLSFSLLTNSFLAVWKNESAATKPSENDALKKSGDAVAPEIRYDKPVPGSTLRCLDDPDFNPEINSPAVARPDATDDRYWNSTTKENV